MVYFGDVHTNECTSLVPRLTMTDVRLTPRLAYDRVMHTAPDLTVYPPLNRL